MASFNPETGDVKFRDAVIPTFTRKPVTPDEVAQYKAAWKAWRETPAYMAWRERMAKVRPTCPVKFSQILPV